jgi:hypothetical protein
VLMIAWGTLATQWPDEAPATAVTRASWASSGLGMALALAVFMTDALRALPDRADVRQVLPATFNWPMFCLSLVLMAAPLAHLAWRLTRAATRDPRLGRLLPTSSPFRR